MQENLENTIFHSGKIVVKRPGPGLKLRIIC